MDFYQANKLANKVGTKNAEGFAMIAIYSAIFSESLFIRRVRLSQERIFNWIVKSNKILPDESQINQELLKVRETPWGAVDLLNKILDFESEN